MHNKKFTPNRKEVRIDNLSAYNEWVHSLRKFSVQNELRTYTFDLSEFSEVDNRQLSSQANELYNACGCKTGSFFMSMTAVTMVTTYFASGGSFSAITWKQALWTAGITLAAAIAGKVIGLLFARWQLIQLAVHWQQKLRSGYSKEHFASF